ncbi:hypothetical protein [Rhodococcus chondri]|uniref:Integral membrane protein n=1 Tax=Rhodococcus chondri TaxID=3065941 RepID=A0ABU7JTZ1_9NOCA|nr:hypothetical protein [Rhodococcus sp. CC-R104]MEE2033501.1 hypothetical protein [Rhodococcus sp. CC-R104]
MLVATLVLAAIGFGLLVIALMTGSVIWAWGCIAVCVVGAVLLLTSALGGRTVPADRNTAADRRRERSSRPARDEHDSRD